MFGRRRLKKAHAAFLKSCRNLEEGRNFWEQADGVRAWILELITPVPLLGLHEDGRHVLEALEWLEGNCESRPLGEQVIKEYHRMVYQAGGKQAGEYRRYEIDIEKSVIRRRPFRKIAPAMMALDQRLARDQKELDSRQEQDLDQLLRTAVWIHHQIGIIHPFADGNGRVARLSMNHFLRRYGASYVIYPPLSESEEYWEALQTAHRGNFEPLVAFARRQVFTV